MKVIKPSFSILGNPDGEKILQFIEIAGRVCYKSEAKITHESSKTFVLNLIKNKHESVLEHQSISVKIICDCGISKEITRHRIASFSQLSTRYYNFSKEKNIEFIKPCYWNEGTTSYNVWENICIEAERAYFFLIKNGSTPQEARSVLPSSLKTELIMTANLREWRHFFNVRAAGIVGKPHPQMLEITIPMLREFKNIIPIIFDDILTT